MGYDGSLKFDTKIDDSGFSKGVQGIGSIASKGFGIVEKAVAGIATGLGGAAAASIAVGSSFEQANSQLAATMGKTVEQISDLTEKAKELGASTSFSATEVSEGLNILAQSGLSAAEQMASIEDVLNLAAAGSLSLESAAAYTTGAIKGFGDSMDNAQKYADMMAKGATLANTNVDGLGQALSDSAATARTYGQSVESTTLSLLKLAEQGVTGSAAATSLSAAMKNLYTPTDQAKKAMQELGVSAYDSSGKARDFNDITDDLTKSLSNMSDEQKNAYLNTIFGIQGLDAYNKIASTSAEKSQKFADGLAEASEGMGAAASQAETMLNNLKGSLTKFQSETEGLGIEIYESFAGPMQGIVDSATDIVSGLTDAFKQNGFQGLVDAGADAIVNIIIGMTNAIPGVMDKVNQIIVAIGNSLMEHSGELGEAGINMLEQVVKGLVATSATLGNIGVVLVKNLMQSIIAKAPGMMKAGADLILSISQGISKKIPELIPLALKTIVTLGQAFVSNIPTLLQAGINMITAVAQGFVKSIPLLVSEVPTLINSFWSAFDSGVVQLLQAGWNIIKMIAQGISDNLPLIIDNAGNIVSAIYTTLSHINLLQAGKTLITDISVGIRNEAPKLAENFKSIGSTAMQKLKSINWAAAGKNLISLLKTGVSGAAGLLSGGLKAVGTAGLNAIKSINWLSVGQDIIKLIVSGLKAIAGLIGSALSAAGRSAISVFKSINWTSVGTNIINGIVRGVTGAGGRLFSSLRNLAHNALSAAKSALGIHSPSKVFEKEVGHHIVTGIIKGIQGTSGTLYKNMRQISLEAVASAKNAVNSGDLQGAGESMANALHSGISSASGKTEKALQNVINASIKTLKKKDKKNAKNYKSIGTKLISAMKSGIEEQTAKISAAAQDKIESLSQSYQEAYDGIIKKQDSMLKHMTDVSNLYDLDSQIEKITEYQKNLNSLRGRIPDSLMDEILGMDVGKANTFTQYLGSLTDEQLKAYTEKWNQIQNTSSQYSNSFFANDLNSIKSNYTKQVNAIMADAQKQMSEAGMNIAKGLINGLKSQQKNMSKEVKAMANSIISQFKKALKIKSPSRIMRDEVGYFLPPGITLGFKKAMPRAEREITSEMAKAVESMQNKMTALEYDPKNVIPTVSVPNQVIVVNQDPAVVNAEIHTTVEMDGAVVGKKVTPYVNQELANQSNREERGS